MKRRSTAWKKYRQYQSDSNYKADKEIGNRVNCMVKTDQAEDSKKLIQSFKGNLKKCYGYMRRIRSRPVGNGELIEEEKWRTKTE